MKNTLMLGLCGLALAGFAQMGCAADIDEEGAVEGEQVEVPTEETAQPLLGTLRFNNCSAQQQATLNAGHAAGRMAALSPAFANCLLGAVYSSVPVHHAGSAVNAGPYSPWSGDPYSSSAKTTQFTKALYATGSTSDVTITCEGGNFWAHASRGSHDNDRERDEVMGFGSKGFQWNTSGEAAVANAIWHEAMHQWGYSHSGSGCPGKCYDTMPYIVGTCMEEVVRDSASCNISCSGAARAIIDADGNDCTCVDDPRFDVGVIPDAGESCPYIEGRSGPQELTIYMDDEDDSNATRRSGWIGKFTSNSNTTMRFCRVPGKYFHRIGAPTASDATYAVIKMGESCPSGSKEFTRYFDNEDDDNENYSVGHLGENSSDRNTRLRFCQFDGVSGGYSWGFSTFAGGNFRYGVFTGPNHPWIDQSGYIYTDDEDSSNENSLYGSTSGSSVYLSSGKNTKLRMGRTKPMVLRFF